MATVGFIKLRYGDTPEQMIDTMNKNFAALEYILANGKLNGTNLDVAYLNSLEVDVARITGELIVGENVSIGETLGPIETAIEEKKRVFTNTPTPPYDIGDIWLPSSGNTGVMKVCQIAKTTLQAYSASDWRECLSYTEPTGVTTIINGTVTTDFVNALKITAGSINADDINAGTITGMTIKSSSFRNTSNTGEFVIEQVGANNIADFVFNVSTLANTKFFEIYNNVDGLTLKAFEEDFLTYNDQTKTIYPVGAWDFLWANVHGVVAEFA